MTGAMLPDSATSARSPLRTSAAPTPTSPTVELPFAAPGSKPLFGVGDSLLLALVLGAFTLCVAAMVASAGYRAGRRH